MKKTFKKLVGISTAVAMCASLLPATAFAEETMSAEATEKPANENLLRIWYDEPAADWQTEALAIGNGYMGGLVFGGIAKDKIHINEKTVWNGGPTEENNYNYGNTNPTETEADLEKIKGDLNAIREKLDDKSEYVFGFDEDSYQSQGTNTKGEAMDWLNKLMGDLNGYDAPEDYANIYISSDIDESQATNYVRDLDMRTALATVNYDYEGVHYTREYFNSYPDNVLVVRLTADEKGKIDFTTNIESCMTGISPSNTADGDTITMKDTLATNGLKTEAQLKVLNEGGELTTDGSSIQVSGADAATLILACGTDYKMEFPKFRGEDPHNVVTQRIADAVETVKNQGYDVLKQAHVADHSALFSRMELGFNEEIPQIPTDELIKKYRNLVEGNGGEVPTEAEQRALEVICYQFGRYLTIAGSREGSLPTNLQGVWGEGSFMWYGDYHFNINVQMNYWPTMASNLKECLLPYNDFLSVLRQAGREAAAASFGIKSEEGEENGWLVGCFSTPYMFASMGQKNNAAGWNPIGSAWALLNSYEYYLYTEDVDFLKALYPSMKEVANFWNEALYWSEYQQRYVSAPSYSPENGPIVNGASYDQQFIWQHFENTIQAAKTLGVDADLVKQWEEKQSKLDPVLVGKDGQVKEWFEETSIGKAQAGDLAEIDIPQWRESLGADSDGEQPPHRHLSHLMALYPCNIINKDNPEFMDAAIVSLNERGLDATGWSKAHKLNLWARTGHAEEAFQIVQSAVGGGNSGFLTNLFSSHGAGQDYKEKPIFQIDGNFGYTAGVNEMLLQSQLGYVQFLPTLPEQWKTGFVNGIVARGNFEIDMKWTDGIADSFVVTSNNGGEFVGEYANLSQYVVVDSQGNVVPTTKQSNDKIAFQTQAGETYTISKNGTSEVTYPVKIEATEHGTVSISQEAYREGEEVYLTVIPEEGYKVEQVVVADKEGKEVAVEEVKDSEEGNYRFKMPASEVTVKAVFEKMEAPTYPVKIEATEHGTVSVSQEAYREGEEVYLTVTPEEGYKVEQVVATDKEGNEVAVEEVKDSEEGNYRFKMPASEVMVKAVFEKMEAPTYPVKIEATDHGTVSISQEAYHEGEEVYLTVIPDESYKVERVVATDKEGNEVAVEEVKDSEEGNYRFKMPASEVTVKAVFTIMDKPTDPNLPSDPNKPETPDTEKPNNNKPGSGNNSGNHQKPAPQKPSTNTQNHAVKTGDNTAVAGAATLCLLAGGAVLLVFLRRRKQIR